MDRLVAMRAFVEIVDRGSLTAAAEALNRSLPTIVRTLAALESHLGVELLRRTTRTMSLTPEGSDYLQRCRRILADVDDAERSVGQHEDVLRGDLRMTAPVQFGQRHVVPAVTAFLRRHEEIRIHLLLLDRVVDLVDEGMDLAVRIGPLADSSMIAVRVGEVRRVVCASPALLRASGTPAHPGELKSRPCILQRDLSHGETWKFRDGASGLAVRVEGRFATNQIAAAATSCLDGVGFARFLSYQVDDLVRDGRLQRVLETFEPDPWPVSLVYPGGRIVPARLRALLDWLRDRLADRCAPA